MVKETDELEIETVTDVTETIELPELEIADRCDRCGARAYVRILFASETPIDLCAHHYQEHEPAIAATGPRAIRDEREKLEE